MEPVDLPKVWDAPDHSRLMPKQTSIRLPIILAAKIAALNDLYPRKTKSEIIIDMLASALDKLVEGIPSKDGEIIGHEPEGPVYQDVGLRGRFYDLTAKYITEFEKEAGIKPMRPEINAGIRQKAKKKK